jgi:methylated-DNA-[protein]-cysteine S-methyltransferase
VFPANLAARVILWKMLAWLDAECVAGLTLHLVASPAGIRTVAFHPGPSPDGDPSPGHPLLREAVGQLRAYFEGALREFTLPLDLQGTPFQLRVWRELQTIPFGEFRTYSGIAQAIGAPRAMRAVGAANGANPVAIVVPCHRVIGSGGKLVGYGGGLPLKKRLLDLERCTLPLFRDQDAPGAE